MKRLKELRKEKNITQAYIANKLHFSQKLISDWENKVSEPSIDTLIALANFFDVSVDYLVGNSEFRHEIKIDVSEEKQNCLNEIINIDEKLIPPIKMYIDALKKTTAFV